MLYREENLSSSAPVIKKIIQMCAGLIIGFIISRIFFVSYTINNNSMLPGLKKGDKIIIAKYGTPEPGDIILIKSPIEQDKVLLKRLIANKNDTIEIKNKEIFINNKKLSPGWAITQKDKRIFPNNFTHRDNMPPVILKKGEFFLLNDNLDSSFDSRTFGKISEDKIIGKVIYKF